MTLVGHWKTLAEAQKLSLTQLITGVFEETIEFGGLINMFPVAQVTGTTVTWNRENTLPSGSWAAVHDVLQWSGDVDYTQKTSTLKILYKQTLLDNYIESTYGNFNNYRMIQLFETKKGILRTAEDAFIYGDTTYTASTQMDGLHAWAAESTGTDLDIDEGEGALSLMHLRQMLDAMKNGCDLILMPKIIARQIDAYIQEAGVASWVGPGGFQFTKGDVGLRVTLFDGVPILRSDYMVAEQANTGVGSDARAKHTSGTAQYSIFGIKFGNPVIREPGIGLAYGGTAAQGEFFNYTYFEKLEDYDAQGLRLIAYVNTLLGSSKCLGRIYDITGVAVTA